MKHQNIAALASASNLPTLILGLSVAVEGHAGTFRPRQEQYGIPLFGDLRWKGWAAALNAGYADRLIVIGGLERLSATDCPPDIGRKDADRDGGCLVPRGAACCHALTTEFGVDRAKVDWKHSIGNTGGNAVAIKEIMDDLSTDYDFVISSNHYHLPRALMDLQACDIGNVRSVPAEAFWVAEQTAAGVQRASIADNLTAKFGGGPLAARIAAEIQGVADKLNNRYQPLSA